MFDIIFSDRALVQGFASLAEARGIKLSPFQCAAKVRALRLDLAKFGPVESFKDAVSAVSYVIGFARNETEARDLAYVLSGCLFGASSASIKSDRLLSEAANGR
jgi:hypothetical protein